MTRPGEDDDNLIEKGGYASGKTDEAPPPPPAGPGAGAPQPIDAEQD